MSKKAILAFWTQIEAKVFLHKKSCGGPRQVIAFIKNGDNLGLRELGIFISSAFLTTILAEFSTVWLLEHLHRRQSEYRVYYQQMTKKNWPQFHVQTGF